jgi:hypothetical protein
MGLTHTAHRAFPVPKTSQSQLISGGSIRNFLCSKSLCWKRCSLHLKERAERFTFQTSEHRVRDPPLPRTLDPENHRPYPRSAPKTQGLPDSHDLGFTYRLRKNGDIEILHLGRLASALRRNDADDFKRDAGDEGSDAAQQLMARITENYKNGNERKASQHPRNPR